MADEPTKFNVPEGYRLIPEDEYKTKVEAANDLLKFKNQVMQMLGNFKVEDLPTIISEYNEYKSQNTKDVETKLQRLADENKKLKEQLNQAFQTVKQMKVNDAIKNAMQNLPMPIHDNFLPSDKLQDLDPEDPYLSDKVNSILNEAMKSQVEFLKSIGIDVEQQMQQQQQQQNQQAQQQPNPQQQFPFQPSPFVGNPQQRQNNLTLNDIYSKLEQEANNIGFKGVRGLSQDKNDQK